MKNSKKILLLIIGLLICCLLFVSIQIYGKYLSASSGNASIKIANWNIKVNNISIKDNTSFSNTITPVFPGNEHIAPNIIAPTAEGYFDLIIDHSQVDVSFKYDINVSTNPNSSVTDLIVTKYSIDDNPIVTLPNSNDTITNSVLLSDPLKTNKIRIYVVWNDDDATQSMTNIQDSESTKSGQPALLDINVIFTQLAQ